jgi:hypothetical protein
MPTPIPGRMNYLASACTVWGDSAPALRAGWGRGRGMAGRSCVWVARKGISVGADAAKVCSRCRHLPPADLNEMPVDDAVAVLRSVMTHITPSTRRMLGAEAPPEDAPSPETA